MINGKLSCTVAFPLYPHYTAICFTFLKMLSTVVICTQSHTELRYLDDLRARFIFKHTHTHTHTHTIFWKRWVKINFDFANHTHFEKTHNHKMTIIFTNKCVRDKKKAKPKRKTTFLFLFFFNFFFYLFLRQRETEHERGRVQEREGDTESGTGSRL